MRRDDDVRLEKRIHQHFAHQRASGEWFDLDPADVLPSFGIDGFVSTKGDSFKIISCDLDGVPEYLGIWNWGGLDFEACCSFSGSCCGMHFQEASGSVLSGQLVKPATT